MQKTKIILIHGLNNKSDSFDTLKKELESKGHDCCLVTLPGHGADRNEARDFKKAFHTFDQSMKKVIQDPYVVIAFSYGALYLQLWLEKNQSPRPRAQILLAPALAIKSQSRIDQIIGLLPEFIFIISQTPRPFRRYFALYIWEYRTLLKAIRTYQGLNTPFKIPTKVCVDPLDEVIDAVKLKKDLDARNPSGYEFTHTLRPKINQRALGKHHILFHPDYFRPDEWRIFISELDTFIKRNQ